jgi:hypothetical protein
LILQDLTNIPVKSYQNSCKILPWSCKILPKILQDLTIILKDITKNPAGCCYDSAGFMQVLDKLVHVIAMMIYHDCT